MKKLVIMLAVVLFAGSAFAQEESKPKWAHIETNHFWDNWEISVGAGVQTVFNMPNTKDGVDLNPDSWSSFTPAFDVYVNKWITPVVGMRLGFSGLNTKYYYRQVGVAENVENENNYYFIHADALFNLTNWICGYKADRFFNASVFAGVAYGSSKLKDADGARNKEWAVPVGILTTYRLCDAWSLNLEAKDFIVRGHFNNEVNPQAKSDFTNLMSITAGVTYRFANKTSESADRPRRGFSAYTPVDYSQWVKKADYSNLEREKNDLAEELNKANGYKDESRRLQKQNNELRDELAKAKANAGAGAEISDTQLGIFFKIGSTEISEANSENITFMANLIKANKNQKFTVTGYADKETGSEARNNVLSQERAEAVRDALVKAGVDENQINVDYKGCKTEPFPGKGYLNRVAIINQK
ncbi:MAG: OmpA family protein [Bacteroidota bacterium]|nr:OmpA family protein [Bacteroidota bacterium]